MSYKKYYLYKEQVSYDGGVTYQDVEPLATTPSGDPIASYSTLEECEGITSCTCADFTYSPTAFTVSSAATSVTFSYTGCTKPDLTSAATYNWITIGNHTYNTGTSVGNIIANVSANTSSNRTATLNLSLSGTACQNLVIFQESGATPVFEGKYKLTLNDSSIVTAACDVSSAITQSEVSTPYSETVVSAEIGDCVTSIDPSAFDYCSRLTSCTIPNSVTSIGYQAFGVCTSLTSIDIPNSVTSIGERVFLYCTSLTSIDIPNNVTSISDSAFHYCRSLTSVTIPNSVTSISGSAFGYCYSLTSINIPNSVTGIGERGFQYCSGLTSIEIPDSVTEISMEAFHKCTSFASVTCLATTPPTLGENAFEETNNCPIYVPAESVNAYKNASGWSNYASRIQAMP